MAYAEVGRDPHAANMALFAPQAQQPSPITNSYKLYNAGVEQNAGDYDTIMGGYKSLLSNLNNPANFKQLTPQTHQYSPSTDVTRSMSNLRGLSETGGYDANAIADLRARGISPIRSVYSSANRDVDRQRRLQGGYSPNYSAVKAKMAREMSDVIANQVQNVNAGIAERIAQNRLQAAPQYSGFAGQQSNLMNEMGMRNADTINEANKFNIGQSQSLNNNVLSTLSGMQSLYGTTPALAQLFGNQALQGAGLQANINNQNQGNNTDQMRALLASLR